MSDETDSPFELRAKKVRKLAEATSSPMGTLVFRGIIAAGMCLMGLAVGTFNLGLKARAEQALAESPTMRDAIAKAENALKATQKVDNIATTLTNVTDALRTVTVQQMTTSRQMESTSRDLAVLVNHVDGMDKTLDRHERAIEKMQH